MKYLIFSTIIIVITGCKPQRTMEVSLVDEMRCIVDSFVNEYPSKSMYELYIHRIDPHHDVSILFAGDESLAKDENTYYSQIPLLYTKSNEKNIYIYTGVERYIKSEYSEEEYSLQTKLSTSNKIWVIKHSFDSTEVIKDYDYVYPFMPLPIHFIPPKFDNQDSIENSLNDDSNILKENVLIK